MTHLDREIISSVQLSGVHPGLQLTLPAAVRAFQLEDAEEAFDGAEVVLSGVNSFGVRWAGRHLARLLRPGQEARRSRARSPSAATPAWYRR